MNKPTLQEALHQSEYLGKHPIIRTCMLCKTFLDEKSEVIATEIIKQNRHDIEYLVSHGCCPDCLLHYEDLIK